MAPVAKNCNTMAWGSTQQHASGWTEQLAFCRAVHSVMDKKYDYVYVQIRPAMGVVHIETGKLGDDDAIHVHTVPWSSAFPTEPTLGEMIEVAEALARGEWFKLFPEA
jgi:hypothetical protein